MRKKKITRGDVSGVKVNEKEAGKMADLSKKAKLSQVYTNHCLRATAATVLGHKGSIGRESMAFTVHRHEHNLLP